MSIDLSQAHDPSAIADVIEKGYYPISNVFVQICYHPHFIVQFLTHLLNNKHYSYYERDLVKHVDKNVLPFLSDAEVLELRRQVSLIPCRLEAATPLLKLLALLGERERLYRSIMECSAENGYIAYSALLAIGDPDFAVKQVYRLNIKLQSPRDARSWLALAQCSGLDLVANSVAAQRSRADQEAMIKTAARVLAPETAPCLLKWQIEGQGITTGRAWFESNPELTVVGLLPVVASGDRTSAGRAIDILRGITKRGHVDAIRAHIDVLPADVADKLTTAILSISDVQKYDALSDAETPELLKVNQSGPTQRKAGDLAPDELPDLVVELDTSARRLNDDQFYALLRALKSSTIKSPQSYVSAVKQTVTSKSRDAFALALFRQWLQANAPANEKWKLVAVGLLGADQCVFNLTPLIRQWPGESQHLRAKLGLECLAAIGSDVALIQINSIAQKVQFRGLKIAALECIERVAAERGLTRPELEDRIIPDCGLDDRGTRLLDFGPRQFAVSISHDMKPVVRELQDGKPPSKWMTALPKPNQKDDPEKTEVAVSDWKVLKKLLSDTAKMQAARLEQAMVTGRRWSAEEFELLLVRQPLMMNIVRLLLWGIFNEGGSLVRPFRVDDDLAAVDSSDETFAIPKSARIGLVHPLHLVDEERKVWIEMWSDYELIPPFPQLNRPVYKLTLDEADSVDLCRFSSVEIPAATLVFGLDRLGWIRGVAADAGCFDEHAKAFYGAGVTAVINYSPSVNAGFIADSDDQTIDALYFIPKLYTPTDWWPEHKDRVPWKSIDPTIVSEVLSDLTAVVSKVK
jgi:hypothetical protein